MNIKKYINFTKENNLEEAEKILNKQIKELEDIKFINSVLICIDGLNKKLKEKKDEITEGLALGYLNKEEIKWCLNIKFGDYYNSDNNLFSIFYVDNGDSEDDDISNFLNNSFSDWQLKSFFKENNKELKVDIREENNEKYLKYFLGKELYIQYNYEKMKSKVGMENNIKKNKI